MSERKNTGNMVRVARGIFALATLAALVLALVGSSRAQAQSTASKSAPGSTPASAKVAAVNTALVAHAATPKPAAKPAAPNGQSEGIRIHGHWTIEVKNPDGKVVTHREFENAVTGGTNGGMAILAGLLSRVVTPGSWMVVLADSAAQQDVIGIAEAGSLAYLACPTIPCPSGSTTCAEFNGTVTGPFLNTKIASCANNLSLTGPQLVLLGGSPVGDNENLTGATLTFTGAAVVPQGYASQIGYVVTYFFVCAPPSVSPATCIIPNSAGYPQLNAVGTGSSQWPTLTARTLDGQGTDPQPVPVVAGQTVTVGLTISFQ